MNQAVPLFINHFISSPEGNKLVDQYKEKFPDLHALVKHHQKLHKQVLDSLKKDSNSQNVDKQGL